MPGEWKTISRRTVFSGGPIQEIAIETVQLPGGRIVSDYYQIRLSDYVLIYLEMPDGTVPLLRQYKHGLRRVCLAFPGGAIEEGETPLSAARRELREELGYEAEHWEAVGCFVTNANQACNTAYLFKASVPRHIAQPVSDDLEESETVYLDPSTLFTADRISEIGHATHVALLFLAGRVRYVDSQP